jgi:NAD(P)-dependent dehydrogenase (short-subunit alcohol dehydrogenase family)
MEDVRVTQDASLTAMAADYRDRRITVHEGNIGSAEDCRRVLHEVIDQHGRVDILVNNAGITIDRTVAKMTDEDWHKVIAVNLSGAFFMAQAVARLMIERGTGRRAISRGRAHGVRQRDPHRGPRHVPEPGGGRQRRPPGTDPGLHGQPAVRQRPAGDRVRGPGDRLGDCDVAVAGGAESMSRGQ